MFWTDQVIDSVNGKIIINDSKTLSGRAHVGSLRGPLVHDLIYRAAKERKRDVIYYYGSDDYDALDAVPPSLPFEKFSEHLGKPLVNVPSPSDENISYAEYYMNEFTEVFNRLGIYPSHPYKVSELYKMGKFNSHIKIVLEKYERIHKIYFDVSGSQKDQTWVPFQVICENCGKIATTVVSSFDGEMVTYVCQPDLVNYTKGCGYEGKISPFDGNGKLPWKLEWAAKWGIMNINVEGAGIDHSVAGGSRSVSEAISNEIFSRRPPHNIPYEFMLIESKKMSSSKGVGYSAVEVLDFLPPELMRFLLTKTAPKSAINFSLDGDSISRLFDAYDAYKDRYFDPSTSAMEDSERRVFELAQIDPSKKPQNLFVPRFTFVTTLIQTPEINGYQKLSNQKGESLTVEEKLEYEKRAKYASQWLRSFAPENYIFQISKKMPKKAKELSEQQKSLLIRVAHILELDEDGRITGDKIHNNIHEIAVEMGLKASDAFRAVYCALLARDSGPKAGNLIAALDRKFVISRFKEISSTIDVVIPPIVLRERRSDATFGDYFQITNEVHKKFPSLRIGVAILEGVVVKQVVDELESLKQEIYSKLRSKLSTSDLSTLPLVNEYRRIYKGFGVDPRSRIPSAEALLKRVLNGHDIYRINVLVDTYNLSSAEFLLPMATYDLDKIALPVKLRFSDEGENHIAIGNSKPDLLKNGELVYADQQTIICRDFNYKDSELTKVTLDTKRAILFVDGCDLISVEELEEIILTTAQRIIHFCGGHIVQLGILYKEES